MTVNANLSSGLEAAYERAQLFLQAKGDLSKVVRNSTLVPHWIGDTEYFWYRRQTEAGVQFRLVNAKLASNQEAFDHQALASSLSDVSQQVINADNLPITQVKITLSPSEVNFVAFDQHYCFDSETNQCRVTAPDLEREFPERLISPDGKKIVFARNYNLWVKDIETDEEKALTQDGERYYCYASLPISFGTSQGNALQARWSPDSKKLFTVQTDNRQVKSMPLIEFVPHDGSLRPMLHQYPTAWPGDEQVEQLRLLSIDVGSGAQKAANFHPVRVNRSTYGLFTDNQAWWSDNSRKAYFVDMARGDQVVRVVEFDTHSGDTRILFEETSDTYVRLSYNRDNGATLLPIPETNELIWYSDRSGWAHLYLYDLNSGTLKKSITKGNWVVRDLIHFDANRRELWIQTCGRVDGRDPYYLDICRVNIDTGIFTSVISSDHEYRVMDSLGGNNIFTSIQASSDLDEQPNTSSLSPDSRYIVAIRSRADQAPVSILFDRNGKNLLELEPADVSNLPDNWQWPEPVALLAADGKTDIYGAIFRPSSFTPDKQYPVIDASMCSLEFSVVPKGSFDNAEMGGDDYLDAAALAELGFIVVMIDGRGTPFRDKAFFDFGSGSESLVSFSDDRIAGIRQLAERYSYFDLNRVGIMAFCGMPGAVYGLLQHPEFYKVGVSHAFHDPRLIATVYGELYEGIESRESKNIYAELLVGNLKGKLLLMHGLMDKMDHSTATWRLVDALQNANKDFDMLILPNEGSDAHIGSNYAFRRTWDYFVKHLQQVEPPKEFKIGGGSV